ncbi:MAG: sugar phosphate isomerase/epimerase [Sedimentisphaerales bacterium]|nr:sugar phosphate isomerase/epimerase [Sedimentisphaerales bacterium]
MMKKEKSRRQFIKTASVGALASLAGAKTSLGRRASTLGSAPRGKAKYRFQLGLASYTLRKFNLDDTLAMTKRLGLKYVCFKSCHLPLDSTPDHIRAVVEKVEDAGLMLYGGGVIYMGKEDEVHQAFDYARAAGMKVIVGAPAPQLLPLVDEKVKKYDIKVAIHNHGPGDKTYPTPAGIYEKIKDLDKRIGICHDIGHTIRVGSDPIASSEEVADRLLDIHIKDVSQATPQGHAVEVGRGVINIPEFLKTLMKIDYSGIVSFEYEKDAEDPMAGLAESVGYVRGVLAAV